MAQRTPKFTLGIKLPKVKLPKLKTKINVVSTNAKPEVSKVYVIMNLPGHAVDFLDALPGILCEESR